MPAGDGRLVTEELAYDEGRRVTVRVPSRAVDGIVHLADGAWHIESLSAALDGAGDGSTMLVAVQGRQDDDGRLAEYVLGLDAERFAAHERFFVHAVGSWVAAEFGVALAPERTAVWGASLGAELALALGVRHPDRYGSVLAASPGAGYRPPATLPPPSRAYLVAGTEEPFFLANAQRWAHALDHAGVDVVLAERVGAHGDPFWVEEFPRMVGWALGRSSGEDLF